MSAPLARRALLIGVDRYPNFPEDAQLGGCVNDVTTMAATLTSFGFDDPTILRNEEATRDGILAALGQLAAETGDGDVVFVHYSGHGSQMRDREGDEPDGWDETIVPSDSGRKPHPNRDISDDEIHVWLREIGKRTPNVTLIFDCCHSGTITRDVFSAPSRWVAADDRPVDELPASPVVPEAGAASREVGPSGWLPIGSYVLLAGCRDDESSYEYEAAGSAGGDVVNHGALTYFLTRELAAVGGEATYRDVFERARANVSAMYPRQHPQIEGAANRELFGLRQLEPGRFVRVTSRSGKTVVLAAGAAHGALVGSRWDVLQQQATGDGAPPAGRIVVTTVGVAESQATVEDEVADGAVGPGARAVERERPVTTPRAVVEVDVPPNHESDGDQLTQALNASPFAEPAAGRSGDFRAYVIPPRAGAGQPVPQLGPVERAVWAVVGRDGKLAMPTHPVDEDGVAALLVANVETLVRYRNTLALSNTDAGSALRGRVDVALERRDGDDWKPVRAGTDGRAVLYEGDRVRIDVTNRHTSPIFVAVLDFGLTGTIAPLYPRGSESEAVVPDRTLVVGDREGLVLALPKGFPFARDPEDTQPEEGLEIFRVFALTKRAVTFDSLFQAGVRSAPIEDEPASRVEDLVRDALTGTARASTSPQEPDDDWTTVDVAFLLRAGQRPRAGQADEETDEAAAAAADAGEPDAADVVAEEEADVVEDEEADVVEEEADVVEEEADVGAQETEPRELFYDPTFAWLSGVALLGVFLAVAWPMWILAVRLNRGGDVLEQFPALVTVTLVLVGIALAIGALYLALFEFRARARAVGELAAAAPTGAPGSRSILTDAVKVAPDLLKEFGRLTTVAALLATAALLFLCGTVLAWRGLDEPAPTQTPTTSGPGSETG